MKYASLVLVCLLLLLPACTKGAAGTQGKAEDQNAVKADDPVQKIINENATRSAAAIKNPKTMTLETKPRPVADVTAEDNLAKTCGQQFLEYAAKNGVSAALSEMTKSRNGAFANYLPKTYTYNAVLVKTGSLWKIVAHATSPDYVGLEVDLDKWKDLTDWLYLKEIVAQFEAGKSNQVIAENIYWKDPGWAGEKVARFLAYNRFYTLEGNTYWMHNTTWVDE